MFTSHYLVLLTAYQFLGAWMLHNTVLDSIVALSLLQAEASC